MLVRLVAGLVVGVLIAGLMRVSEDRDAFRPRDALACGIAGFPGGNASLPLYAPICLPAPIARSGTFVGSDEGCGAGMARSGVLVDEGGTQRALFGPCRNQEPAYIDRMMERRAPLGITTYSVDDDGSVAFSVTLTNGSGSMTWR